MMIMRSDGLRKFSEPKMLGKFHDGKVGPLVAKKSPAIIYPTVAFQKQAKFKNPEADSFRYGKGAQWALLGAKLSPNISLAFQKQAKQAKVNTSIFGPGQMDQYYEDAFDDFSARVPGMKRGGLLKMFQFLFQQEYGAYYNELNDPTLPRKGTKVLDKWVESRFDGFEEHYFAGDASYPVLKPEFMELCGAFHSKVWTEYGNSLYVLGCEIGDKKKAIEIFEEYAGDDDELDFDEYMEVLKYIFIGVDPIPGWLAAMYVPTFVKFEAGFLRIANVTRIVMRNEGIHELDPWDMNHVQLKCVMPKVLAEMDHLENSAPLTMSDDEKCKKAKRKANKAKKGKF